MLSLARVLHPRGQRVRTDALVRGRDLLQPPEIAQAAHRGVLPLQRGRAQFPVPAGAAGRRGQQPELLHGGVPDHVPERVLSRRAERHDPAAATEPDRGQAQRQVVQRPSQCAVDGPRLRRERRAPPPAACRVSLLQVSCSGAETDSAQDPGESVLPPRGDRRARAGAPDRVRGGQSTDPHKALFSQSIIYRDHRAPPVHAAEPAGRRYVRVDGAGGRQRPGEAADVRVSGRVLVHAERPRNEEQLVHGLLCRRQREHEAAQRRGHRRQAAAVAMGHPLQRRGPALVPRRAGRRRAGRGPLQPPPRLPVISARSACAAGSPRTTQTDRPSRPTPRRCTRTPPAAPQPPSCPARTRAGSFRCRAR
ncbi:hypothetical protein KL932_000277 [Ogataea haglerorum]|nr:hypothetical protein KL932_000277 [Ogataea haglerorum]